MFGFGKIMSGCHSRCKAASRARAILILVPALLLGHNGSAKAEIFPFRTVQGNPPIILPGVTVNVHQGAGDTVEFTFVNICSSSTTAQIKEIAFADPCTPGVIVLNSAAIGPENTPGCTQTQTHNACPPTSNPPCVNYTVGGNLSLNFECPFGPNIVVQPANNDGSIDKGESLTVIFTLNLQVGETAAQAFDRLLACMTGASFDPCVPGLRVGFKFQGGDQGGGGANAINIPFAFPPEDCNENGIPDVCDISCNGFNGFCQVFNPLCGQFPGGFGVPTPTNVLATPAQLCPGGTSSLSAETVAGNTLEWFVGSCGGQIDPFATGSPVSTDVLTQTTTFFVRAKSSTDCFSSCAQVTVTVDDTTPPDVTCPAGTSASADATCMAAVPNYVPDVTAGDNCSLAGNLVITQSPTAGTLVGLGATLVTVTVTDEADNSSMCQVSFTVNDTTTPVITSCGPNQSASANASCMAPVPDFIAGVVASDNCATIDRSLGTISQNPAAGTLVGIGPHTITVTVSDNATPPNTATCTATFTVNDTTGPTITTCPTAVTVFADANCNALVPDLTPMVVATDNCTLAGDLIVDQTPVAGSPLMGLGLTPIHITVTDPGSALIAECDTSVTVVDNMPPAIDTCAGPQNIPANQPLCTALIPDLRNGVAATDNCDFTVSQVPAPGTSVALGPHDVTLTVTDPANQTDSCLTTVTVVDVTPPAIGQCAPSQMAVADSSCEATVPDFTGGVSATDDCSAVPNLTVTQVPVAGTVVGVGMHTVTITVSDEAMPPNTNMCTTTFTVNDTTAPNFVQCADDQMATADGDCQAAVPDFTGGNLVVGDNCSSTGEGTLTITQSPLAGSLVGTGVTVVTITAEDDAGNTETCTATFTVNDTTPPVIICPASIDQPSDPEMCGASINYPPPGVSDNCANRGDCGPVMVNCELPPGSFFPVGTTTVTCTATDCTGNTASCSFTITVNDTDSDSDGVPNCMDDCPATPPDQRPIDSAGCSCLQAQQQLDPLDVDDDGVPDACDNCVDVFNPGQEDCDSDGMGDACEPDGDSDGIPDDCDVGACCGDFASSCAILSEANCINSNGTYLGDGTICAQDSDSDGVSDCLDCCPDTPPGGNIDASGCQGIDANAGGPYQRQCPDPPGIVSVPLLGIPSGQISTCTCAEGVVSSLWTTNCPGATILNPTQANATLQVDTRVSGCPLACEVTLTVTLGCLDEGPTGAAVLTASATAQVSLFDDCNNNGIPDTDEVDSDGDGLIDDCDPDGPAGQAIGACCFMDSTCQPVQGATPDAAAALCTSLGGNFAGDGTDCLTTSCQCGQPGEISLLFTTLSFAPVCGGGCLMMIPLTVLGFLKLRSQRKARSS
ncbi:MAG TPA: HYR domain-containing protein [Phycisphaerae bacterium]|nr:HYR domain-containing protein [Phycisphaerae bacterium]